MISSQTHKLAMNAATTCSADVCSRAFQVSYQVQAQVHGYHTGLIRALLRLFRPFLMWLFRALESKGLRSSKLQRSSEETLITAPQLSNSPQYYQDVLASNLVRSPDKLTFGALNTVTSTRSLKNSYPSSTTMCARHTRSKLCRSKNCVMTFFPKQ